MSRCSVVIKFGPRSGRKCRRLNCPYHHEEARESTSDSVVEPSREIVVEPAQEIVTEPAQEIVVEPAQQSVVEPAQEIVTEPIQEIVVEPAQESVVNPAQEIAVKPAQEIVVEPAQEIVTEPIQESVVEPAQELTPNEEIKDGTIEDEFVEITEEDCKEQTDVLVIDTETIGLPPHKTVPMTSVDWERSRAIQIAWKKVFSKGGEICRNYIIRPDGFEVKLTSIHGISQKQAEEKGTPIKLVLKQLREDLKSVATIVAHNIEFDYQIIAYEFFRSGLPNNWGTVKRECTMALAKKAGLCDGPIRLAVLYEQCFNSPPQGDLHRADVDVELCARIYSYLSEKMSNRVYFRVDFKDKDVFKFFGGQWDPEKKKWYTYECHRFMGYLKKWFQR